MVAHFEFKHIKVSLEDLSLHVYYMRLKRAVMCACVFRAIWNLLSVVLDQLLPGTYPNALVLLVAGQRIRKGY